MMYISWVVNIHIMSGKYKSRIAPECRVWGIKCEKFGGEGACPQTPLACDCLLQSPGLPDNTSHFFKPLPCQFPRSAPGWYIRKPEAENWEKWIQKHEPKFRSYKIFTVASMRMRKIVVYVLTTHLSHYSILFNFKVHVGLFVCNKGNG